ncbi:MAG: hypothetical protein IPP32_05040 [Bacteroidetes bacterium]|nr:hypothetical protein [Bacteroidota bacterium]
MMGFKRIALIFSLVGLVLWNGCKEKDSAAPENPFAALNEAPTMPSDTVNPNSFLGIHKNILAVKCANPSCHDGSFEPDYRSVESSYNTLVYHPVIKQLDPWPFRVIPFDTAKSWLWQRVIHERIISNGDTSGGRMPLYKDALSTSELNNISTWIMNGARDIHGQVPSYPNQEPKIIAYGAFDPTFTFEFSKDVNRVDSLSYNPFIVSSSDVIQILTVASDDSTEVSAFQNCTLKLSLQKDNFAGALSFPCTYFEVPTPNETFKTWRTTISAAAFPTDTIVYMRFYANDGDHPNNTEFPLNESVFYYKSYWAFYIKP